jgi:hypothetical protein
LCPVVFRIPGDEQSPENPVILKAEISQPIYIKTSIETPNYILFNQFGSGWLILKETLRNDQK